MKNLLISLVSFFLMAGCGDVGSSSVEVNQEQEANQVQNAEEATCTIQCTITAEGDITGLYECTGQAPFLMEMDGLEKCDTTFIEA